MRRARQSWADQAVVPASAARIWALVLAAVPIALAVAMHSVHIGRPDLLLVVGLALFGLPFAVNSSLHSYLILAYAGSEKSAEDVGFYYAANAAGRLLGITLSGVLYQLAGIQGCLIGSAVMLLICWGMTYARPLKPEPASERERDPRQLQQQQRDSTVPALLSARPDGREPTCMI